MESIIKVELIQNKQVCRLLAVLCFVIFTALSAFVRIPLPFTPVPLTLQTFFVLLSGCLLGRKLGLITQFSYIFLGLSGQSVFTGSGSGAFYLLGPTGGYITGFVFAAFFAGRLFGKKEPNPGIAFLKLLSADLLILACGTLWLKLSFSIPLSQAILIGFLPFVAGDIFKVALATVVYGSLHSRIKGILY